MDVYITCTVIIYIYMMVNTRETVGFEGISMDGCKY